MIHGASTMKRTVSAAEPEEDQPEERRGDAPRPRALPLLEQLAEDGHERGRESAASATSARTVFGIRKAISNALMGPRTPK